MNDFRLRPLHNPEGIDTSVVPPGFRMLYADEAARHFPGWLWFRPAPASCPDYWMASRWCGGQCMWPPRPHITYITAVNPRRNGLRRDDFKHLAPCSTAAWPNLLLP